MKAHVKEFFHRGLVACGGGPLVLAIIYGILGATGVIDALTPWEVSRGILTITLMAFLAGGVTVVYQIEKLPLFPALLLHGIVLYLDYLMIYLCNGWIAKGITPILVFTGVFAVGYAVVWLIIYAVTRKDASKVNRHFMK